jgi:hypothetical protein
MKYRIVRTAQVLPLSFILAACHSFKALPDGISFQGKRIVTEEIAFVSDTTWVDGCGQRHIEQAIFEDVFRIIAANQSQLTGNSWERVPSPNFGPKLNTQLLHTS